MGDFLNALLELGGALLTAVSVRRIWKDKGYAGIYPPAVVFFTIWGGWNLYYYQSLNQPFSTAAASAMFLVNTTWVISMLIFGRKK